MLSAASIRRCLTLVPVESRIMSAAGIRYMGGIPSPFPCVEPTQVEGMGWDSWREPGMVSFTHGLASVLLLPGDG